MEPFNVLVIDEAAQLRECESVIPLHLPGLKHIPATVAVFAGRRRSFSGRHQLVLDVGLVSYEACFGRSLYERLSSLGHSKLMLNVQYRMHPAISYFPNVSFYHGQVQDAENVKGKTYERKYLQGRMYGPYSFISIPCGKEELDDIGHSRRNMVEVALVNKIVKDLYEFWRSTGQKLSVGVISPYTAQVVTIKDTIGRKYDNLNGFAIKVKSIDGFQGGEEDIIIISTVRFNSSGSIGFMKSLQRTNVALTRARHCLWILGNERTLFDSNSVWKGLVLDAKGRQCLFSADEDSGLSKTILDIMKELDQLDDLLNADSIVFKSQRWKVLLNDNFKRSFKNLVTSSMKMAVLNLLIKLAGGWRPKRKGVDLVCETSSQIVKKFKVEGYYIVCTIDIQKEAKYTQVLRAWDLLSLDEAGKLLKRLDGMFARYTDDFINLCKQKCLDGDLEVPKSWPASLDLVRFKNRGERLADSSNDCVVDVDFEIDGDLNGEVVGSSVIEVRADAENAIEGSPDEHDFHQAPNVKVDHDLSGRDVVSIEEPETVSNSAPDEPYVGQEFESEAAAHAFYNAYATRVGFIIRVSKLSRSRKDGSAIGRALVCNKEGFRMADRREKVVRQRAETRVGCRAMILVRKVSSGKWIVTKFVKEHTHPLTPGKGRRESIYDQFPNEHDKIRELSQQLAAEKKRSATYKRHLEMIFEHIEEHNQSLSKKIQDIVNNVREMESRDQQNQQNRR
nr:uncharacterized protein LOC109161799 isoform X1 [Ipomoea trifida]